MTEHTPMPPDTTAFMNPLFLGFSGENSDTFERLLLEFVRDHVFWRRNFHPEDPPAISPLASFDPEYQAFIGRTHSELNRLTAALKHSVPFCSPRYLGHMVSDSLMPGLLAQLVTTLYNPNNVSMEAAPVTIDMELEVGRQLAQMFGFSTDPAADPCAFGHLTSGGTVANYEALVNLRAAKLYPLALAAALRATDSDLPLPDGRGLAQLDDWTLLTLPMPAMLGLPQQLAALPEAERNAINDALQAERYEHLGLAAFAARHPESARLTLLAPVTAHYSWKKAAGLLGLGADNLISVPVDRHMRMDGKALEARLEELALEKRAVLAVVPVLGTTEFGSIDPVHTAVGLRDRWAGRGFGFAVHVDAAWGGYVTSMFRQGDGGNVPRDTLRREFTYFPSTAVYDSFTALGRADSITVDPHKLGYLPFGVGGIVWRDRRILDFVRTDASYVFETGAEEPAEGPINLGQYILEGSKPGSVAAAVWTTHRVLPLQHDQFGRLQRQTVRATEYFSERVAELTARLAGQARLILPFEPDTNLLCLAVNPEGNRDLAVMNRFGWKLYDSLGTDANQPVQTREFFASHTSIGRHMLDPVERKRLCEALGIDEATFTQPVEHSEREAGSIFLLRHTLMNPWLLQAHEGHNYIDQYCEYLGNLILRTLDAKQD